MFRAPVVLLVFSSLFASDSPTFQSDVKFVRAEARVYEAGKGRVIENLKAEDFQVRDNGSPREIVYFGSGEEPLDLLLLLDVSGTMLESLPEVAAKAGEAMRELHPGDRVAVSIFGKSSLITQPFTSDFQAAEEGLWKLMSPHVGLDTDINSAVLHAARYVRSSRRRARRAILTITDNMQVSPTQARTVERELYEADAVLDGIIVTGRLKVPLLSGHGGVYRFAAKTGGETIEGTHPAAKLAEMIRRIRARYSIYFRPLDGDSIKPHRISIELSSEARRRYPKAIVRGRTEYYPAEPAAVPQRMIATLPDVLIAACPMCRADRPAQCSSN